MRRRPVRGDLAAAVGGRRLPLQGDMKTIILTIAMLTTTTAALAQETTVTLPEDKITAKAPKPCVVRELDQGRGSVKICG